MAKTAPVYQKSPHFWTGMSRYMSGGVLQCLRCVSRVWHGSRKFGFCGKNLFCLKLFLCQLLFQSYSKLCQVSRNRIFRDNWSRPLAFHVTVMSSNQVSNHEPRLWQSVQVVIVVGLCRCGRFWRVSVCDVLSVLTARAWRRSASQRTTVSCWVHPLTRPSGFYSPYHFCQYSSFSYSCDMIW